MGPRACQAWPQGLYYADGDPSGPSATRVVPLRPSRYSCFSHQSRGIGVSLHEAIDVDGFKKPALDRELPLE
eukprot:11871021-Prorocentrum_lima.AAC.1